MTVPLVELQQAFVREVLRCVHVEWERIEIHYEFYVYDGDDLEQSTSNSFHGNVRSDLDLSFDAVDLMLAMRNAKPEGQAEHWTSLDFRLDSAGKFTFDYGYGLPPMAARTIAAQPENRLP
ncbi:MAG TPA: hypothetical protein VHM30_02490 [Gemmatimonadaceae bacterium]|nr:hypothetical protein [Gemmatimonadaceae bacterium]